MGLTCRPAAALALVLLAGQAVVGQPPPPAPPPCVNYLNGVAYTGNVFQQTSGKTRNITGCGNVVGAAGPVLGQYTLHVSSVQVTGNNNTVGGAQANGVVIVGSNNSVVGQGGYDTVLGSGNRLQATGYLKMANNFLSGSDNVMSSSASENTVFGSWNSVAKRVAAPPPRQPWTEPVY